MTEKYIFKDGLWRAAGRQSLQPGQWPTGPEPVYRKLQVAELSVESLVGPPPVSWPGDPGDGNYVIGWALGPGNLTVPDAQTNAGWPGNQFVSVIHDYSNNTQGVAAAKLDAALSRGFIASQSFKLQAFTHANIAAGLHDAAIDTMANVCLARDPYPIWLCFHHEPEDDVDNSEPSVAAQMQANFRAATRRIVTRFRERGVRNVTWMPIYMNPWTFIAQSGRDWRRWHPDWTGSGWHDDLTMDVMGMDTYNPMPWNTSQPWYQANRSFWTFEDMFEAMKAKVELPGYPRWDYVIPEFGLSNAFGPNPVNWVPWAEAAVTYARANRVKAFIYWDNASADIGRFSFARRPNWPESIPHPDANGTKKQGWDLIVAGSRKLTLDEAAVA